mgnify:CR=1 FL=1
MYKEKGKKQIKLGLGLVTIITPSYCNSMTKNDWQVQNTGYRSLF